MTHRNPIQILQQADSAYFNGNSPIMEDAAYDALKDKLKTQFPDHPYFSEVGAPLDPSLAKVTHAIPMGSQQKAMNKSEFHAWIQNTVGKLSISQPLYHISAKLDGGSFSFTYKNGYLVKTVTRGNGIEGEDVTHNGHSFSRLPQRAICQGQPFSGYIRGEVVLPTEHWRKLDPEQLSNPRNLGNGISRRKDGSQSEFLEVYAFSAYHEDGVPIALTEEGICQQLQLMGFTTPPWTVGNAKEVWNYYEKTHKSRTTLPYWIDGMVVKLNDVDAQDELGTRDNRPKGQIALKFPPTTATTQLIDVKLTVGHTGAVIPTGVFKPVLLGGTTVTHALLANWNQIKALDIAIGDTVELYKAGDIIPKVLQVTHRPHTRKDIPTPTHCPICGTPLEYRKNSDGSTSALIFCPSDTCPAKTKAKLSLFIQKFNILGIGDALLENLIENRLLQKPGDLFRLHQHTEALANLNSSKGVRFGEKRTTKLIEDIENRRKVPLHILLGSLGIEGLGRRRVQLIQEADPYFHKLEAWFTDELVTRAEALHIPAMAQTWKDQLLLKKPIIEDLLSAGCELIPYTAKPQPLADAKSFCVTGTLSKPKSFYKKAIEESGHIWSTSVHAGLSYLVLADPDSTSSKAKKARQLDIPCITEDQLQHLIKG